jgi:hypothetical protein
MAQKIQRRFMRPSANAGKKSTMNPDAAEAYASKAARGNNVLFLAICAGRVNRFAQVVETLHTVNHAS